MQLKASRDSPPASPPRPPRSSTPFRIHCLEWDAVHELAVVHALSVVTAALGAAIDRAGGCDPEAALTALAVGVDVASGLGVAATSPLTFFRPATAGCLGAALAVARITGAPMADTLGLAYSFASGTMQAHVEGSIALPLQIANAARAAVMAADLAKAGLTGPHDVLEGPFGYFRLFDQGELATYTDRIGERWLIQTVSTKPYPSGRASHGALGLLDRLRRAGLRAEDVEQIELFAPPLIARLVGRPFRPDMTPGYARLCLPLLAGADAARWSHRPVPLHARNLR
jgi:2-methylcitrate dehydratase PrpD